MSMTYETIEAAFDAWRKTLTIVDRPSNQEIFSQGYVAGWNAKESASSEVPWDAPYNRSYEPVETRAAEIYATYEFDPPRLKPAWHAGGNSLRQDMARSRAREELREAGHKL